MGFPQPFMQKGHATKPAVKAKVKERDPVASPPVKAVKAKSTRMFRVDEAEATDEDGVITNRKPLAKKKAPKLTSKQRELAIVTAKPDTRESRALVRELVSEKVEPKTAKALVTRFGAKAEVIVRQLEEGESDGSVTLISRSLLQMLVDILPIAEQAVRNSNGRYGIHGLIMISSQIRESLQDLQSIRDKGLLGHNVVERIVRPSYQDLAAQIVVAFLNIDAAAKSRMSREDYRSFQTELSATRTGLAQYLTRQYDDIQKGVIESLS